MFLSIKQQSRLVTVLTVQTVYKCCPVEPRAPPFPEQDSQLDAFLHIPSFLPLVLLLIFIRFIPSHCRHGGQTFISISSCCRWSRGCQCRYAVTYDCFIEWALTVAASAIGRSQA